MSRRSGRSPDVRQARLLAVDLETTGLDPRRDRVVAVGWVPVEGLELDLAGVGSRLVRPPEGTEVGESATVHGLTDSAVATGSPEEEVLAMVLDQLRGRALLAHHARIETGFLATACRRHGRPVPRVPVVDTVALQQRVLGGRWHRPEPEELGLAAARRALGLPRYRAHDALSDALACAELYLAQVARLAGGDGLRLRRLTKWWRPAPWS